jgi:hypothetical protein
MADLISVRHQHSHRGVVLPPSGSSERAGGQKARPPGGVVKVNVQLFWNLNVQRPRGGYGGEGERRGPHPVSSSLTHCNKSCIPKIDEQNETTRRRAGIGYYCWSHPCRAPRTGSMSSFRFIYKAILKSRRVDSARPDGCRLSSCADQFGITGGCRGWARGVLPAHV